MQLPERSDFWFPIVTTGIGLTLDLLSDRTIESPTKLLEYIPNKKLYHASLHKSMLETISLPYAIHQLRGEIPYVVAGDNLFSGKIKKILDNCGVITSHRSGGKKEIDRILQPLVDFGEKHSIAIFPEGTRTRTGIPEKFKTTIAEIAIQASRERETEILCSNHDYQKVNEEIQYINYDPKNNSPYKFHWKDAFLWLKPLGRVIISFDTPIKVDPKMHRKELSKILYNTCLDLVKIMPENVYSEGMKRLHESGKIHNTHNIEYFIGQALQDLQPYKNKFRYFDSSYNAKDILHAVKHSDNIDPRIHRLYSGYIQHYLKFNNQKN